MTTCHGSILTNAPVVLFRAKKAMQNNQWSMSVLIVGLCCAVFGIGQAKLSPRSVLPFFQTLACCR